VDLPQPTTMGHWDPVDRADLHAAAGDDDARRSRPRSPDPPIHRRAPPSHSPPPEPTHACAAKSSTRHRSPRLTLQPTELQPARVPPYSAALTNGATPGTPPAPSAAGGISRRSPTTRSAKRRRLHNPSGALVFNRREWPGFRPALTNERVFVGALSRSVLGGRDRSAAGRRRAADVLLARREPYTLIGRVRRRGFGSAGRAGLATTTSTSTPAYSRSGRPSDTFFADATG
jgi:hypothetical protein